MWIVYDRDTGEEIACVSGDALASCVQFWYCVGYDVGVVHKDDWKGVIADGRRNC